VNKYKVYIWFGTYAPNPFLAPTHVVEVEAPEGTDDDGVVQEAMKTLPRYPKTYSAQIIKLAPY